MRILGSTYLTSGTRYVQLRLPWCRVRIGYMESWVWKVYGLVTLRRILVPAGWGVRVWRFALQVAR